MRHLLLPLALLLVACPETTDDDDTTRDAHGMFDDDDSATDDDDDDSATDDDDSADDDDAVDDDDSAATAVFELFRITESFGPCPPDWDCWGFIEISADGLLRVDVLDQLPVEVHESKLSDPDVAEVLPALTDPALVAILAADELPCMKVDDVYELMEVVLDGVTHANETTNCDLPVIAAARQAMENLALDFGP